ncbi:MAG: putative zinc-binding metallopeptidase [Acidimicrobiales bacterium]
MRRFPCPACGRSLFFGNDRCGVCDTEVAYVPADDCFSALADVQPCVNRDGPGVCNWATTDGEHEHCANCRLDLVPDLSPLVATFQQARRRTLRQLFRFDLDPAQLTPPLQFQLLESDADHPVITGHENGVITLDVAEADPVRLAEVRTSMGERYRTPIGHVRHELGHWYWAAMVEQNADPSVLEDFRSVFGDETLDYANALEKHYASGDDGSWRTSYVTHYASSHPWEDFAETFAHYLHLADTLETARSFPLVDLDAPGPVDGEHDELWRADFDVVYPQWLELTTVLNELNRSMGVAEAYPFAPPPPAIDKLAWLHRVLTAGPAGPAPLPD